MGTQSVRPFNGDVEKPVAHRFSKAEGMWTGFTRRWTSAVLGWQRFNFWLSLFSLFSLPYLGYVYTITRWEVHVASG